MMGFGSSLTKGRGRENTFVFAVVAFVSDAFLVVVVVVCVFWKNWFVCYWEGLNTLL